MTVNTRWHRMSWPHHWSSLGQSNLGHKCRSRFPEGMSHGPSTGRGTWSSVFHSYCHPILGCSDILHGYTPHDWNIQGPDSPLVSREENSFIKAERYHSTRRLKNQLLIQKNVLDNQTSSYDSPDLVSEKAESHNASKH